MFTQVETHTVCLPPSSMHEDPDRTLQLRGELTDLVVAEKNYFLRIATSILRDRNDAEDVVHTSFCAAWTAMGRFRGDSSMKTWFSRIVTNRALIALRKLRRKTTVFFEDNPEYMNAFEKSFSSTVEDPEKITQQREALQLMHKHMEELPAETRILLALYLANDCSIQQVAKLRGKSCPAVKAHLHRGKLLLRKSICRRRSRKTIASH